MSSTQSLSQAEIDYLEPFLPKTADAASSTTTSGKATIDPDLPFVTLTYASSLDSMISLAPGVRTTLSGPETKAMTHYLRLHHDAILVGVGTAIPDDPGLNSRYPGATMQDQPQPVVVDPRGRWTVQGSKLEQLARERVGRPVWIFRADQGRDGLEETALPEGRKLAEQIYLPARTQPDGRSALEWREILRELKRRGMRSVMIEGGARVISTLLGMPELVNVVIITVAPTWLGEGGVVVAPAGWTLEHGERVNAARLQGAAWRQFGLDVVCCGRLEGR